MLKIIFLSLIVLTLWIGISENALACSSSWSHGGLRVHRGPGIYSEWYYGLGMHPGWYSGSGMHSGWHGKSGVYGGFGIHISPGWYNSDWYSSSSWYQSSDR